MSERGMIGLVVGIVVLAMVAGGVLGFALTRDGAPARVASTQPESHGTGPSEEDYVPIESVPVRARPVTSTGTYAAHCGNNEEGHYNSDNVIVAPGVVNAAHHLHDYVGNTDTAAASTDRSLSAAATTCRDTGDSSAYFWTVLRDRTDPEGQRRFPGEQASDRNVGVVLRPQVSLVFSGNPHAPVVAPPRLLRVLSGDAKAATNGGGYARAAFTCAGFTDRVVRDVYPLCPLGRGLMRILEFPSCWDGRNVDSANHRTHVVFPDSNGRCRSGTTPIPKLTMTLTYDVPAGPSFAIDTFPEQLHEPVTDHGDFLNLRTAESTAQLVTCLNEGRSC